jgi:hypothetical protein
MRARRHAARQSSVSASQKRFFGGDGDERNESKDTMIKGYDQDKAVFAVWSQDLSDYLFRSTIPTREIWVRAVDGRFDEVKERIEADGSGAMEPSMNWQRFLM